MSAGDQSAPLSRQALVARLRYLEVTAYGAVVSALRAQGELSWEKQKLMDRLRDVFHISNERHQAEVARAENDIKIQTIASGIDSKQVTQQQREEIDVFKYQSETESGSDNEYTPTKTTRSKRGRRSSVGVGATAALDSSGAGKVPKKRGRKPKQKQENPTSTTDELEPKRKRGRKKKSSEQIVAEAVKEEVVQPEQQAVAQEEYYDEELENATLEQIEEIAIKENNEIEELESQLETITAADDRNRIMAQLIPKRARLTKLIARLETDQDTTMNTSGDGETNGVTAAATTTNQ